MEVEEGLDLHSTIGKDDRHANLLRSGHVQLPQQRHGQNQEHEIDDDVAESKYFFNPRGRYPAYRGREHSHFEVESTG